MMRNAFTAARLASRNRAVRSKFLSTQVEQAPAEVTFDIAPFATHKIDAPEPRAVSNADELHGYFRSMYRMRRMEMESDALYTRQMVRGFCHLYNGQEAVAVGIEAATTFDDCLITAYRNHCQQLARGDTVESILSELTGRANGCSKGKGGSMHLYKPDNNYYGGNGIVGAQGPLGAGLAFAQKYNNTGKVSITMFGDGAANQGQIFEVINMSALWNLPTVFVCENNRYGMGTSTKRSAKSEDFYTRGDYIPGIRIDGMDVLCVREGMKFAADYARENGPIYVEMDTYRYKGHSISDQGLGYRSIDEINIVKASRDPIDRVKARLIEHGWATPKELKAEEKQIRKEVDAAVKVAETAPHPPNTDLFTDVYVGDPGFIRGTLATNGNSS
ncbi:Pyruvate dehydrogenase E1 component subunit alpha-2, mitochondrial [Gracilariopsis chorda]|uniref:Pyruvate dehydrogenase E1 component subunit alpha n=1 Tax=Gracilariopsis chorda TaxID=448386 RepID=A0A2V3IXD6_9FLOR|nr:Pyruvate dehydrogenase E1 component subunit alpha-2, mitochondrial [Gracilariopsis chorda]|eukprot:PXF46808.1 Pyruvate dehydrogenase E1 component subunit alpha-2, mitochondrial [Gracilariopsis chorda]